MIISRTPYRISFFGGGTDYPSWYRTHGGAVLATTINRYCYITCRYLPPFFEHRYRIVYSRTETGMSIDQIAHPAVRETLRYLKIERGLEIHHDGDLPARSGVASSSAFTVGLLNALFALRGQMVSKQELAEAAIHLERDVLRETVGSQDQVLAAFGGLRHIVFASTGDISVRPVTVSADVATALNDHCMLFYTGIARIASEVAGTYARDMGARESQMRAISELVDEGLGVLTGGQDLARFGNLLHESWTMKRSLSSEVSNPTIEAIYAAARSAGAIGGKLLGAGGGGFMLLFVRPEDHLRVREGLRKVLHVPFRFEYAGSQIIFYEPGEDFAAADGDRDWTS